MCELDDNDPMAPARGIVNGVLLSIPLWAIIISVACWAL